MSHLQSITLSDGSEYLIGKELSLSEWLGCLSVTTERPVYPDFAFPTDQLREEYLATIDNRSRVEVERLIRRFLVHTCTTHGDTRDLDIAARHLSLIASQERYLRMLRKEPAWEGLTWVLEFLKNSPHRALRVIEAYISVHCQEMDVPYWSDRLYDAMALIRAKFIEAEQPRDVLYSLGGIKFERVVRRLYSAMGYDTELTQVSHDGGVDIRAQRYCAGEQALLLIQCKCTKNTVAVKTVRELHGAVENEKASRGALIATSEFSQAARKWAANNPRLELIGFGKLATMLNEYLSPNWPKRIDLFTCDGDLA